MLALIASRAAARGTRWGGPLLLAALVLLNYVHAGFLLYAAFFLVLEAIFYRDVTRFARVLFATAVALVAGLPQHWESWRYSDYFIANNVILDQSAPFEILPFLRKVYYNIELQWLPGRWFNDFSGLSGVCLPITVFVAWRVRTRAGLYAWIALATMALMRLNTPEFAYLFLRPIHVLAVCMGPILAVFVAHYVNRRALALSVIALCAVYLQVLVFTVPHVPTLGAGDPALVERVQTLGARPRRARPRRKHAAPRHGRQPRDDDRAHAVRGARRADPRRDDRPAVLRGPVGWMAVVALPRPGAGRRRVQRPSDRHRTDR